ncbi:unnamed protein product [Ilex paraguariensis]|uniref:Uncharacterized protein n=1 Tax=Ilex paraguariensis TaxID=185542 RepID=A0ABC8V339_9AQUA
MNSSNLDNDFSGFNAPSLGSGKPSLGSASSGLSKPRLFKMRKQMGSHNARSMPASDSRRVDLGSNPFRSSFENLNLGSEMGSSGLGNLGAFGENRTIGEGDLNSGVSSSCGNVRNKVLDDMKKLNIGSEQGNVNVDSNVFNMNMSENRKGVFPFESGCKDSGFDGNGASKLPEEMRKLNIDNSANVESLQDDQGVESNISENDKTHFWFGSVQNASNSFGSRVIRELPNEMKKLNIQSTTVDRDSVIHDTGHVNNYPSRSSSKSSDSLAWFPERYKNLNAEDSVNTCAGEKKEDNKNTSDKNSFIFGTSTKIDGRRAENMISDEIRKLKIGSETGDSFNQMHTGLHSKECANERHPQNLGNEKFQGVSNSVPTEFIFQLGAQAKSFSGINVSIDHQNNDCTARAHVPTASSFSFSSTDIPFQSAGNVYEVPSMDRPEKKIEFSFTSKRDSNRTPFTEFEKPNPKGNLFSGINRKLETKRESARDTKLKKKKGKLKKPTPVELRLAQDFVLEERSSPENPDSFESYSPMDVSPYHETLEDNNCLAETSVTLGEAFDLDDHCTLSASHRTVSDDAVDEILVPATQRLAVNGGSDVECTDAKEEDFEHFSDKFAGAEAPSDESISAAETDSFKSASETLDYTIDSFVTATDTEVSSGSTIERQDSDGRGQFSHASISEDIGRTSFTFAAFSCAQGQSSATTRQHKKKNRLKVGLDSYSSTPNAKVPYAPSSVKFFPVPGNSPLLSPRQGQRGDAPALSRTDRDKCDAVKEEVGQETVSTPFASIAAQEACEKWRLRGNQAYAKGDTTKAEDCYTRGVNSVSQNETSRSCLRALMLCYSNRAAARMSLGRMREALEDCMRAAALDPNFLRVQVRAAK